MTAPFYGEITTRCPACGGQTLYLTACGDLRCGRLDCPEPNFNGALAKRDELLRDVTQQLEACRGSLYVSSVQREGAVQMLRELVQKMESNEQEA